MISRFDDDLQELYYEEVNDLQSEENGSEIFLFILLKKEDSLLNCLSHVSYQNVRKESEKTKNNTEEFVTIVSSAESIAKLDKSEIISDEHLLYAILSERNCKASLLLKNMSVNVDEMFETVKQYLELTDDEYLTDITNLARMDKFSPFVGRKEYLEKIKRIISKKQKNNCMIIGSAGVGKSALVEGVAMEFIKENINETIYRLEIGSLIAGTRYRGDLEERLMEVIKRIKNKKAILFIDEIHSIMGHSRNEDNVNIANILKPILARSEIKCIGATTVEEYYDYIEKDKALSRRFQNIFIPEATKQETINILKKTKQKYEEFYNIKIPNSIIEEVVTNGMYFPNKKYPDKSIDLLDELGAYTKSKGLTRPKVQDIKKIVFENIGISNDFINKEKVSLNKLNFEELVIYYYLFFYGVESRKNIMTIGYRGNTFPLIDDIKLIYNLKEEGIIRIDLEIFDESTMNYILSQVLKYPIVLIIISSFSKGTYQVQQKIKKMIDFGQMTDSSGRLIYFKNAIFVLMDYFDNKEAIGFDEKQETTNRTFKQDKNKELKIETKNKEIDIYINENERKRDKRKDIRNIILDLQRRKIIGSVQEHLLDYSKDYYTLMKEIFNKNEKVYQGRNK